MKLAIMKSILILGAIVFMPACDSAPSGHDISSDDYKKHMKYPTKPQAPLDMKYYLGKNVEVGEGLDVKMVFKTRQNVDDITIKYSIDTELAGEEQIHETSLGAQLRGQSSELILHLVPQQEGFYYIKVFATMSNNGIQQSRSFAIPVNVGNVNPKHYMKQMGNVKTDATGQKIISMPASQPKK